MKVKVLEEIEKTYDVFLHRILLAARVERVFEDANERLFLANQKSAVWKRDE